MKWKEFFVLMFLITACVVCVFRAAACTEYQSKAELESYEKRKHWSRR